MMQYIYLVIICSNVNRIAVMINHFKIYNTYMRFHQFNPIRLSIEENKSLEIGFEVALAQ